jgi:excisionase family DNA binding protein
MTDTDDLLTVSQAAEVLGASSQTIRNWIRAGQLEGVRIGHRFLIPRSRVESMRGGRSSVGESPWDFDMDEPAAPLPRASAGGATDGSDEVLGG